MATIRQQQVPGPMITAMRQAGIRIKSYTSAAAFERDLKKFLGRNHVLHLSTCKENVPRSTPVEYRLHGLTFYVLSEGGAKFDNLKDNKKVSFSIAEPYDSEKDFWANKGLQAWGTAKVYSRKETPRKFREAVQKMHITKTLRKLGMKELPAQFNYRVIEIVPERIKYGNPREGIFHITWQKKG